MQAADIAAGIRTVTHAANYFDELKSNASRLAQRTAGQERGYLTPNEEDEIRGVLISYWQVRNALLELITSYRLDQELLPEDRPAAFLTAFAGAVVLIDAARFLRENVHHRSLVRAKLNEAAPQFGIPERVYESVQESLLSAHNAWHLYHAIRYFDEHESELRNLAATEPLIEIIDGRRHRLDVSMAQFARARMRARASGAVRALMFDTLSRALYGLQKLGGNMLSDKYVRRGHQPQLPFSIAEQLKPLLLPGDVLVVRKEHALTNYFLPGFWPHAALYLGDVASLKQMGVDYHAHVQPRWAKLLAMSDVEPRCVLEAMKDGVQIRSLKSPFGSDSIVVLRPHLTSQDIAVAMARVMSHEGKTYDFDFDFRRSDRLVCTEVVYRAYDGIGPVQFPLVRRAGRPTLSGSDLIGMGLSRRHFDPIAVYIPGGELVVGDGAARIISAAHSAHGAS